MKRITKIIPDKPYIMMVYYHHFKKFPNLRHPKTFNEKLQWLKLNDRRAEYTNLVDKYRVKEYVASMIGEEYIIPTLAVWSTPYEIEFSKLPEKYVLKWNHDSGSVVIHNGVNDLNEDETIKVLEKGINRSGYWYGREWPYKNVKPCIFAEKYMEDNNGSGELTDYKLHFFSGECKAIMVGKNRFGKNGLEDDFYTPDWKHFDFSRGYSRNSSTPTKKPMLLDKMIELGSVLAKKYPFVRVDFYLANDRIYFGEITFYPSSGFGRFHPDYWDDVFGEWIQLPK